jgi:predicted AAA+ superfamily ATPase
MISRFIQKQILELLKPQRVVTLLGARRVGKTVLMNSVRDALGDKKVLFVQGENLDVSEILSSRRLSALQRFVEGYDYLFVDEAQVIPDIGLNLKLLVDNVKDISILVSGSSSFDLKKEVGEPLVGRGVSLHLYPLAQLELKETEDMLQTKENLEQRLIYGSYPQVVTASSLQEKRGELEAIRDGYLLKDILSVDNQKDSHFVFNLLRLIAFQIGNDISYSELASNLNVHNRTVRRYLELLEKTFVLFSLQGFSRNLRKEYTKTPRYYFWDNGMRNILISNLNSIGLRDDVGKLWENYCIVERVKKLRYQRASVNFYFWRTYDQKEIDLVEERDGVLFGYEMKWKKESGKPPKDFLEAYPQSSFEVVNRDNYLDFVS